MRANIKSSGESVERMKSDIAGAQARLSEIARQIDDNGAKADESCRAHCRAFGKGDRQLKRDRRLPA